MANEDLLTMLTEITHSHKTLREKLRFITLNMLIYSMFFLIACRWGTLSFVV